MNKAELVDALAKAQGITKTQAGENVNAFLAAVSGELASGKSDRPDLQSASKVVSGGRALGSSLVADPRVGRLILTGAYETAAAFRRLRQDLPILAETSGKNAMIVMPSADLDLAASDLVKSAFGHAGQKCSAASLAILVGPVARSERFARQLVDATEEDWGTEYLAPIISIKVVKDLDEAIAHINKYGSHHTDAIMREA